ncbi:MAG: hypothetical protein KBD60_02580 [Sterolibacterium sp.]|jgi:MSHA biogenesis protein MshP|nr:hypothetical protein [Sterolibacterium sp.]
MRPEILPPDRLRRAPAAGQRGFAILMAVFILVILALLSKFVINTATLQHTGSALDVMGLQAYQAANGGVEWGMARVKSGGAANCAAIGAGATLAIDTMNVTVTCNVASSAAEAGVSSVVYTLTAIACNAASCPDATSAANNPNYVERSQIATAEF